MTDLDAIRARDAAAIFTTFTDLTMYQQAIRDRRALLAEVDRLTAERSALAEFAGVIDDERARIREAVLGEPTLDLPTGVYVDLEAVLEDIDGQEAS